MHAVIIEDLEEYLSGQLPPRSLAPLEAHLAACGECRRELQEMQESAGLLASLKTLPIDPPAGFVASMMQSVAARSRETFWTAFSDFAFARRVVFASLLMLGVLGTVLVSREEAYAPNPTSPEAVMADAGSPTADQMLVTLANYEP